MISEDVFENPLDKENVRMAIAYLATYLFIISGHRTAVIANLTLFEFQEAEEDDWRYVIHVMLFFHVQFS